MTLRILFVVACFLAVITAAHAHCPTLNSPEAEQCFLEQLQLNPSSADLRIQFGQWLEQQGRSLDAANEYIASTNIFVEQVNSGEISALPAGASNGLRLAARAVAQLDRKQEAESLLRSAATLEPSVSVYRDLAVFMYQNPLYPGSLRDIRAELERAIELASTPDEQRAIKRDAAFMLVGIQPARATELLYEALALAGEDVAERTFVLSAVAQGFADVELWYQYARVLLEQGALDDAVTCLTQAAHHAMLRGEYDTAEYVITQALQLNQDSEAIKMIQAQLTYLRGDATSAVTQFLNVSDTVANRDMWLASAMLQHVRTGLSKSEHEVAAFPVIEQLSSVLQQCWGVSQEGEVMIEGHIYMPNAQFKVNAHAQVAANTVLVKNICEIGLNTGHSSVLWLEANPKATLYSFDFCANPCSQKVIQFLKQRYGDRFQVICGDSTQTIPLFMQEHPEVRCDIAHVDGGHQGDVPITDLRNMRQMVNPAYHVLVMDDVDCSSKYCQDPQQAWQQMITEGLVTQITCDHSANSSDGYCYGRYN